MKEPTKRNGSDSWNQFMKSGAVEDYLAYVSGRDRMSGYNKEEAQWGGVYSHAGIHSGNRNYSETDTYR